MGRAASTSSTLEVHFWPDAAGLGRRLARRLDVPARAVRVHEFPDGESLPRVRWQGARRAVLVHSLHDPNGKLFEVALAADALRRAGARHLTLVAPYLPYMRQDAVFRPGEPLSQRVAAEALGSAFDRVLTLEAHLHRVRRLSQVFPCAARSLSSAPAVARWLAARPAGILVGPDEESEPWVRRVAGEVGLECAIGRKVRRGDARVDVSLPDLPAARRAYLVDDIASSGATLAAAARALAAQGIARVDAIVIHGIFAPGAAARLRRAGVERVVTTETVPHASNRIRIDALFAEALRGRR